MKPLAVLVLVALLVPSRAAIAQAPPITPDPEHPVSVEAPALPEEAPAPPLPDTTTPPPPPPVVHGTTSTAFGTLACNGSQARGTAPVSIQPGYFPPPTSGPALPWTELAVTADATHPLLDAPDVARALLLPAFDHERMTDEPARTLSIARAAALYGYQLVRLDTATTGTAVRATATLAPLPIVRKVDIDVREKLFDTLLDEEIRRRMALKAGSYVPYWSDGRTCELLAEEERVEAYLRDEGYFDAEATLRFVDDGASVHVKVKVTLGQEYKTGHIDIVVPPGGIAVPILDVERVFDHRIRCFPFKPFCIGKSRFTRAQHQQDLQEAIALFHKRGYPAVRVTSDYDPSQPASSLQRDSHTVNVIVNIDQRRLVHVQFDGPDHAKVPDEDLRAQLTFDQAGSSDDVETGLSAAALATYLQKRGFFDAHVTWTRVRIPDTTDAKGEVAQPGFDQIFFHLELGPERQVRDVEFRHDAKISIGSLDDLVATKPVKLADTLFGTTTPATSKQLEDDRAHLESAYHHAGYRDAQVRVSAASAPSGLDSAAMAAALLSAARGDDLYVRFDITEGTPTYLARVEVTLDPDPNHPETQAALCDQVLGALADALASPAIKKRDPTVGACGASITQLAFKDDVFDAATPALRAFLANHGRLRASVDAQWRVVEPHRVVAHYDIHHTDALVIGKVVIRGNFRTRDWVIRRQMHLREGRSLTADALANAERDLRAMSLFDSVTMELPSLCVQTSQDCAAARDNLAAIVRVQERYDYLAGVEVSAGGSTYSGLFVTVAPSQRNLFGIGLALDTAITIGSKIFDLEGTLRVPRWLAPRWFGFEFQTELTAFWRDQDTPNFGELTTQGLTVALSRTWPQPKTATHPARTLSVGVHYDFRSRQRNVDALRPIGFDGDSTQVPVTTETGSVGVTGEWDQRDDRHGGLSPLSPEAGFRLSGSLSWADTLFLGQDDFLKLSLSGTRYQLIGDNLVIRADLRYDQGIPLGGAVLLPEVERFFAGGDATVRGYADDRLSTELVQVGLPPIQNVSQLRVLASGGNIRAMGSLDAQIRIWRFLASGMFADAGMITNQWSSVSETDFRPAVGMALFRIITPFGVGAVEYAVPLKPQLGDDPRGRFHISFAARAQF